MSDIRAIETHYAGYRFRSRLEARYAVFFDHLGIRWEYEAEGYATPAGWYLPDFVLHLRKAPILFEVKPESDINADGDDRWYGASEAAGARLIVAFGMLHPGQLDPCDSPANGYYQLFDSSDGIPGWDNYYAFCACPWCGEVGIEFSARGERVCGYGAHGRTEYEGKSYTHDDPRIIRAYTAALSARFEHGATP